MAKDTATRASKPTKKPVSAAKAAPAKPKANPKSEEFVVESSDDDSDSEGGSVEPPPRPTVPAKTKANGAGKSRAEKGSAKVGKAPIPKPQPESASSSEESEEESEDESDAKEKKTSPTQKAARKGSSDDASSDSSSAGDESDDEDAIAKAASRQLVPVPGTDSDESMPDAEAAPTRPLVKARELHASQPRPVKAFKPPTDFEAVTPSASSPTLSKIQSSLAAGYQIWHITAPRDVPLGSIKDFALQGIANGEPVLSHNNTDYTFNTGDSSATPTSKLLLPSPDGYKPASLPISRTLHLQPVVKLDTHGPPRTAPLKRKRPQPAALKQRFLPVGVVDSDVWPPSDSEEPGAPADDNAQPGFRAPPSLSNGDAAPKPAKEKKAKKRKDDETPEERAARKAAKKAKKEAKAAGASKGGEAGDGTEAKVKKRKKDK